LLYNWTLSLDSPCPADIPENDGIGQDSFCKILTTSSDPVVKVTSLKFFEYGDSISDLVNYELMEGEWLDGDQMSVESITKNNEDVYTTGAAFELKGFTEEGTKSTLQWVVDYTNACSEDPYENISSIAWLQFVSLAFVPLSSVAKSNLSLIFLD
jgi:hypothetical protein